MAPATEPAAWPPPVKAWFVVAVLFVAYIASFIDRTILSLLVEPIKADLALSDIQIGLVSGLAFGIFYSVMGLPLGWLADHRSRRNIIIVGMAVWSLATAACGLARSFEQLFVARIMVGIGEAALAPAALSLISDLFPPHRRPFAVSVFVMAGSVGGGAAMILGGRLIAWIETFGPVYWPALGTLEPWQAVFLAVGLPGLLLCLLVAATSEPARRVEEQDQGADEEANLDFPGFLRSRFATIGPLFAAMTLLAIVAYGFLAWIPSFFIRSFGWSAAEVGTRFGLVFLVCGAAGAISGGAIASWLRQRGQRDANLRVVALGLTMLAIPVTVAPSMGNGFASLAAFAPVMFLVAFPSGAAAAAVQDIAPNAYRGRTIALYYVIMNLFGLAVGAVLVATVAEHVFAGPDALGMAMAAVGGIMTPAAAMLAWFAARSARGPRPAP